MIQPGTLNDNKKFQGFDQIHKPGQAFSGFSWRYVRPTFTLQPCPGISSMASLTPKSFVKLINNFLIYYLTVPQPTLSDSVSQGGSLTNLILIAAFLNLIRMSLEGNQITTRPLFPKLKQRLSTETYISTVFGMFSLFQI